MKGLTARRVDFLPEFFAATGGPEWAIDASTNEAGPNDRRPAPVPGGHRPRLTLHELQSAWRTDGPIAVSTTSAPREPSIRIHAALRRRADCLKGLHSFSHHVFDIGGTDPQQDATLHGLTRLFKESSSRPLKSLAQPPIPLVAFPASVGDVDRHSSLLLPSRLRRAFRAGHYFSAMQRLRPSDSRVGSRDQARKARESRTAKAHSCANQSDCGRTVPSDVTSRKVLPRHVDPERFVPVVSPPVSVCDRSSSFSHPTALQRLAAIIVAIASRIEYSRVTAFLNLLPDSRLR